MWYLKRYKGFDEFISFARAIDQNIRRELEPQFKEIGLTVAASAKANARALFTGTRRRPPTGRLVNSIKTSTINTKTKIGTRVYSNAKASSDVPGFGKMGTKYSKWRPYYARFLEFGTNKSRRARAHTRRMPKSTGWGVRSGWKATRADEGRLRRSLKARGLALSSMSSEPTGDYDKRTRKATSQAVVFVKQSRMRAYHIPSRPFMMPAFLSHSKWAFEKVSDGLARIPERFIW